MGRTSNTVPGCSLCLEEDMVRGKSLYGFISYGQWFDWIVRAMEKIRIRKLETKWSGAEVCGQTSLNGQRICVGLLKIQL